MLIKNMLQVIFVIFIFIVPFSLVIMIYSDIKEFIEEIRNIHKK
jgi:hypothetical protein